MTDSILERPDSHPLRGQLHGLWAAVAPAWEAHAAYADARGAGLAETMLAATAPRAGERVLELACGPAGLGIAAAPLVGSAGEVVLSDVVPEMAAIAGRRAEARDLANVRARVLDLEAIDEPDASYDVLLCREGLMLVADPARGAREMTRVLRPGGRLAVTVWGPRERNPWLGIVFDAVTGVTGQPVPPPGVPGPFSLSDAARLRQLFLDTGLERVELSEQPVPLRAATFDEWWERTCALAGPLAQRLAGLPDDARAAIEARARERASAYATPDGLEVPGVALVLTARR